MTSYFFDCATCTKVNDCATCGCLPVTLGGLVNITNVKDPEVPASDSTIWFWHLQIENCSGKTLCVSTASLVPRWKFRAAASAANQVFQPFLEDVNRIVNITSTIPNFDAIPLNWFSGQLNEFTFMLPPGKFFIDVTAQVLQSEIDQFAGVTECGSVALFPSPFSIVVRPQRNAGCAQTITVEVGCNPDTVVITEPVN